MSNLQAEEDRTATRDKQAGDPVQCLQIAPALRAGRDMHPGAEHFAEWQSSQRVRAACLLRPVDPVTKQRRAKLGQRRIDEEQWVRRSNSSDVTHRQSGHPIEFVLAHAAAEPLGTRMLRSGLPFPGTGIAELHEVTE